MNCKYYYYVLKKRLDVGFKGELRDSQGKFNGAPAPGKIN